MGNHFVALTVALGCQKFLHSENGGDDESNFADDEGLDGEESKTTEENWDECDGLQLQEKEEGSEGLEDLLLLATSCKVRKIINRRLTDD